jgi:hypothetical protein
MINFKRLTAGAIAFALLMNTVLVSGCGKRPQGTNEIISADSTWYNMEKHELEYGFDPDELEYFYPETIGMAGDLIVTNSSTFYKFPPDVDFMTMSYVDYYAYYLDIYDKNGDQVNCINVVDLLSHSEIVDDYIMLMREADSETEEVDQEITDEDRDDALSTFHCSRVSIVDDKLRVTVTFAGPGYSSNVEYDVSIDPATSEFTYELDDSEERGEGVQETPDAVVILGDYRIEPIYIQGSNFSFHSFVLDIYDDTGLCNSIDFHEKFPDMNIEIFDAYFLIDDHTLLIMYYPEIGPVSFLTVDIESGAVDLDDDGEYQWLRNYNLHDAGYFKDIGNVVLDDEGIKCIDFENDTLTEVFSFDSCNVNRGDISGLKLISYSEEEIVFVGALFKGNMFHSMAANPLLIVLTKAETNPNAGKTVLTAATVGSIDYAVSEAVCIFNETDPDYFIRFDNRYKADNHVDLASLDYMDDDAYDKAYDQATIDLSNQLAVDLMAGDGPDIIFDTSSLSQLDNEDYLLDLSDRINTDGLFSNVIEAAKTDGKLYQIPLTFGVTGIAVLDENIEPGQTGFTFDQYATFVSTVCNGKDPLAMDQTEFFVTCMDAMGDQFITGDGDVDYDNDALRALASYTDEYVFPPIVVRTEETNIVELGDSDHLIDDGAVYMDTVSFDMYLASVGNHAGGSSILGIPSIDGRGPLLTVGSSVAISAQTAEADACRRFVETLLSPEVQTYYAQASKGCPICVDAYEAFSRAVIDEYNRSVSDRNLLGPEAMALYGSHMTELDYSVVDDYEAMICSCSSISRTDPAVTVIVREEMPAYFSGQKTIEEVIDTMENRVQTFLNERG